MSYYKGKLSRKQIIEAGAKVVLAKGYDSANTSGGKLTHHFPTKGSLFEAIFERLLSDFESGPLARLADMARSSQERACGFLDSMYALHAMERHLVGCPRGHAAADSDGVSSTMKKQTLEAVQKTTSLFERAFRDLRQTPALSKAKAQIFVSARQGAVVVARSGEGLKHIERVFRSLKDILLLSV